MTQSPVVVWTKKARGFVKPAHAGEVRGQLAGNRLGSIAERQLKV
jgi:hypothetical protein